MSASKVISSGVAELEKILFSEEICMIILLINAGEDQLMAYQHTKRSNFFTRHGVDKNSGTHRIAEKLQFNLLHSIGAGDTPMDNFLLSVGLALHVGNYPLKYQGQLLTMNIANAYELGEVLAHFAEMQHTEIKS